MGAEGYSNEKGMIEALDGKKYRSLPPNLQEVVSGCLGFKPGDDAAISAELAEQGGKPDIVVSICGKKLYVSIKSGHGNSVHQEPVEDMINYFDQIGGSPGIAKALRLFIWGDGTENGTGHRDARMSVKDVISKYPDETKLLREFLENHKRELITRFIKTGGHGGISAEFIYYGTPEEGYCASADSVIDFLCDSHRQGSAMPVGGLSMQAWNRAISSAKSDQKRGNVQLKWPNIEKDIQEITRGSGTSATWAL